MTDREEFEAHIATTAWHQVLSQAKDDDEGDGDGASIFRMACLAAREAWTAARAPQESAMQTGEPHPIFAFLDGSASFEGVWFGERHPTRKGGFWWRSVLREAISALPVAADKMREVGE